MPLGKLARLKQWPEVSPPPNKLGIYLQLALDAIHRKDDIHTRAVVENEADLMGQETGPTWFDNAPRPEPLYRQNRREALASVESVNVDEGIRYFGEGVQLHSPGRILQILVHSEELRKNLLRNLPAAHHRVYHDVLNKITAERRPFLIKLSKPELKRSPLYIQPCIGFDATSSIATEIRRQIVKELVERLGMAEAKLLSMTRNVPVDMFRPHMYFHHKLGLNDKDKTVETIVYGLRGGAIVLKATGLLLRPMKMRDGIDQTFQENVFPFSQVSLFRPEQPEKSKDQDLDIAAMS